MARAGLSERARCARPYAQALFAYAQTQSQEGAYAGFLRALSLLIQDPQAHFFLDDPRSGWEQKKKLFEALLESPAFGANELQKKAIRRFLGLLYEHKKLSLLADIHQQFLDSQHEAAGELWIEVEVSCPLSPSLKAQMQRYCEKRFAKKIVMNERLNPSLGGGFRLIVGDEVIERSVQGLLTSGLEAVRVK